jgi:hypothetical protein
MLADFYRGIVKNSTIVKLPQRLFAEYSGV